MSEHINKFTEINPTQIDMHGKVPTGDEGIGNEEFITDRKLDLISAFFTKHITGQSLERWGMRK